MSEIADRHRRIAAEFTRRVEGVPERAWDNPAPCEGWVARDVIRHLVGWGPSMLFGNWNIESPEVPSVDDDPVGAWRAVDQAIQAALDDPEVASAERETQMGMNSLENVADMIWTTDVMVHTWDLARATGQDDALDAEGVSRMYGGLSQMDPEMDRMMRESGHFGTRVGVADDADDQTKLLAFTGRKPDWTP